MNRRNIIRSSIMFLFSISLVLVSAACSFLTGVPTAVNNKPLGGNDSSAGTTTLRFFANSSSFREGNFSYKMVQQFTKAHPAIKVEISTANGKQWDDSFLALAASNDMPDIIQPSGSFSLADLMKYNWVQPIEPYVSQDFRQRFGEGAFVNGINVQDNEVYSFPRSITKRGWVLVYNKDILAKAGLDAGKPPRTWDELELMSRIVKEKLPRVAGIVFPMKDSVGFENMISLAQTLQPTLDIKGFDYQKGRYDLASEAVMKAVEFVFRLKEEGLVHPNAPTLSLLDAQGIMANKQAAFMLNTSWIVRVNQFEMGGVGEYDIAPLPTAEQGGTPYQPATTAGADYYMSATTKHPKEAGMLLDWLASYEFYERQLKEDLNLPPIPAIVTQSPPASVPLQHMAAIFEQTIKERPIPESNRGAAEVKKAESVLPRPKPDWWEVLQGAYFGKQPDWKEGLRRANDAYNRRFEQAIENTVHKGITVAKDDFMFIHYDGRSDYPNE